MIASIEWLRLFIDQYSYFEYLIIFLGAGFGGELVLFALGFLAAHQVISIYYLVVLGFFGILFSDTCWFLFGRTKIVQKIVTHRYAHSTILVINKVVDRVSKGNDLMALIIAKFLIGTRILLIMHFGSKFVSFKKFIHYDSIAVFLWLLVIISIGFISGLGFVYFAKILENIYFAVGFILLIIFLAIMLEIWLQKRFTEVKDDMI